MKKIDLHSHSYFSDGTLSPKELVLKANADGIDVFALTDHDTVSGIIEAEETAKELNLKFIRGIEISAFDEDCKSIHVLGLGLKDLSKFKKLEATNKESRKKRNLIILDGYNKQYNQNINLNEIEKHFRGTVGSGNLSQFLFNQGIVNDYKEADNLLNEFRASQYGVHISEAINVIHSSGGLAFLAHPYSLKKDNETLFNKISEFKAMGLDGVECFHSNHSIEQSNLYLSFANKLELLISGGSDFHGAYKPNVKLGFGKSDKLLVNADYISWI